MPHSVKLTERAQEGPTNSEICIICQSSSSSERTTSTANGRKRIREVSALLKDVVFKRLKCIGDKIFVYHMNNECYKKYTNSKTVNNKFRKKDDRTNCTDIKCKNVVVSRRCSGIGRRTEPYSKLTVYKQKCVICGLKKT